MAAVEDFDEAGGGGRHCKKAACLPVQSLDIRNQAEVPAALEVRREPDRKAASAVPEGRHDLGAPALRRAEFNFQCNTSESVGELLQISRAQFCEQFAGIVDSDLAAVLDVLPRQASGEDER